MGRRLYPPEVRRRLVLILCRKMAEGMSARKVMRRLHIRYDTLWDWIRSDEGLAMEYAQARAMQAHFYADEQVDLSDGPIKTKLDLARVKFRAATRRWAASKMLPRTYGPKTEPERSVLPAVVIVPMTQAQEARRTLDLKRIAEVSSDTTYEEVPGLTYVDVDETPREMLPNADADAEPELPPPPKTKAQEILERRRKKKSGE